MSQISHIISVLENFQGNEDEINAWKDSDDCIDTALQIISTSNKSNVIFLAATVVRLKLLDVIEQMDESQLDSLFQFFLAQISSGKELESSAFLQLLKCAAFIACANLDFMDQVSFLPQDVLLNFFEFCFETNKSPIFFNTTNVIQKLTELFPFFIEILANSELTIEWFRFHTSVMGYKPFSEMSVLIPRIQEAAQNPAFYTGIFMVFEYTLTVPFGNSQENPEDIEYIDTIIIIMLQIAEALLQTDDVNNLQLVHVIYKTLIDYGPDYFIFRKDNPEIMSFFDHFLNALNYFTGEGLESELLELISFSSSFITYGRMLPDSQIFNDFMLKLLQFMIDLVNGGGTRFLQHRLRKAFKKITDVGSIEENPTSRGLQPIIYRFFTELVSSAPTPGIFYAIAYSSEETRMMLSSLASQIILSMEEKPFTVVYFTRTCSQFANESIVRLLLISYEFAESMPREVAKTISIVANNFYNKFIENSSDLIDPVLEWIQSTEPEVTSQLLAAMFSIITHVAPTNESIGGILETLTSVADTAITSVVESEEVVPFIKFLITIIKGTPLDLDPAFYPYFNQLYDGIQGLFENLWVDPTIFSPFAKLLKYCVSRHWLNPEAYMETITEWLGQCFPDNVVPEHFTLICACLQYLESDFVEELFNSVIDDDDKDVISKLLKTCVKIVFQDNSYLPLSLNIIFHNLAKMKYSATKAGESLAYLMQIEDIDLSEVAEQIPPLLIPVMLNLAQHNEIYKLLEIFYRLKTIVDPSALAAMIVEAAGNTPKAVQFGETFLNKSIDDCFTDAVSMVIEFRSSEPASAE